MQAVKICAILMTRMLQSHVKAEEVRQGFEPNRAETDLQEGQHTLDAESADVGVTAEEGRDQLGGKQPWEERELETGEPSPFEEERNAWAR